MPRRTSKGIHAKYSLIYACSQYIIRACTQRITNQQSSIITRILYHSHIHASFYRSNIHTFITYTSSIHPSISSNSTPTPQHSSTLPHTHTHTPLFTTQHPTHLSSPPHHPPLPNHVYIRRLSVKVTSCCNLLEAGLAAGRETF